MSTERTTRFERVLPGLFDELAGTRTPAYLEAAIERASSGPQRPSWTFPGRWLPVDITTRTAPFVRVPWGQIGVIVLTGLLLAVVLAAYIGSQRPGMSLLARGSFMGHDWGLVEFEAFQEDSVVTGRMTVHAKSPDVAAITVELQCARMTEDGLIMIGGHVTESTLAAVALKRGSPVQTAIWVGADFNLAVFEEEDCLAYLDAWLARLSATLSSVVPLKDDSEAVIEFGP